jgi:biopolymer transport protein ExbD
MAISLPQNGNSHGPISELNTTPLIDVMLVLLVMFIITMPLATHAVKVDLPATDQAKKPPIDVHPTKNIIGLTAQGALTWNGAAVDRAGLLDRLAYARDLTVPPVILFQPAAEARYDRVDSVLADIKRSGITTLAFVGNERYTRF